MSAASVRHPPSPKRKQWRNEVYYHRRERDDAIGYLASKFPKCFFEDPTHRRPLKHNIILDLEKENVLDREN
jgi:sRNA-binding protein